jgi:hypothetical protein
MADAGEAVVIRQREGLRRGFALWVTLLLLTAIFQSVPALAEGPETPLDGNDPTPLVDPGPPRPRFRPTFETQYW